MHFVLLLHRVDVLLALLAMYRYTSFVGFSNFNLAVTKIVIFKNVPHFSFCKDYKNRSIQVLVRSDVIYYFFSTNDDVGLV